MGVKSTVELERGDAENKYADLIVKHGNPHYFIHKIISEWDNDYLEEQLEELNDQAAGGEGFANYRIKDEE